MPPRRRRRFRRLALAVLAVLVIALTGGYWYQRPLLLTGTGYAAHNACAVQHIAGRTDAASDLPPNPLVPVLRTASSDDETSVRTGLFGLLSRQRAWHTAGLGCTIAAERPALAAQEPVPATGNPFTSAPAPAADPAVDAAIARAFGDDLVTGERSRLGTRAIVVVRDGRLVAERYAPGFTATTPQLGWSMAKSAANLLLGTLVRQGTVRVTDAHLLPQWRDERAAITIEQLARMTSGLTWDETYALGTPVTRMLYREPDMGGYAAGLPLAHDPGTYQQYSSGSTNILCAVLHARTRIGADLPRRQLFGPLGLSSAVWEPDAAGHTVCSSYLWATPRDWAAIGQFALREGEWNGARLLPEDWMSWSTRHLAVRSEETNYAAGWWVNALADGTRAEPSLPEDTFWAQGHDGQRLNVVPSAKLVVVRLGFSPEIESKQLRTVRLVEDVIAAG